MMLFSHIIIIIDEVTQVSLSPIDKEVVQAACHAEIKEADGPLVRASELLDEELFSKSFFILQIAQVSFLR